MPCQRTQHNVTLQPGLGPGAIYLETSALNVVPHGIKEMQFILGKAIFYHGNKQTYHNGQAVGLSQRLSLIVDLLHQMKYFQCEQLMPNTLKY